MRGWPRRRRRRRETTLVGSYEFRIDLVHGGTRSEGRIGRLFLDGDEIHGATGDRVELPDGRVVTHLGDERPHLWSVSGWALSADERR